MTSQRVELPVVQVPTHDNTMLRDHVRCPRLYAVHHVLGWRSQGRGPALAYGSLVHLGMETYYHHLMENGNVAEALMKALDTMQDSKYTDPPEDFRTKGRALLDMKKYVINYKGDLEWKILLTETAFDIEDEQGFRYGGRLDLIISHMGRLFPLDHKTTTRFGPYFYDNFKMDPQMYGYFWAASQLTGEQPAGVFINTIVLHKKETTFDRKPILFSKLHIERWRQRNIAFYRTIAERREADPTGEAWSDVSIWTPNFENCVDRYGQCPMYNVCHASPLNADFHLRQHFAPGKWDFTNVGED